MTEISLAIIGGGPKAAAICAKIACLRELYDVPISAVVFEKYAIGAHWSGGDSGYTDGIQPVCTPPERDLGFPYSQVFGEGIATKMLADHSWASHLIRNDAYARWVGDGRPRPSHGRFADYIAETIERSGATVYQAEVVSLRRNSGAWTVGFMDEDDTSDSLDNFHGVVVTGSGPPLAPLPGTPASRRLYDGQGFWRFREVVRRLAVQAETQESDADIVIIGAGGTAAAIAGWLVRAGVRRAIHIIGSQPTLYGRTDSAFENRMFENIEVWNTLSPLKRREFCDRLTRGAVWQTVIDDLARADNVHYTPGTASRIELDDPNDPEGPLKVTYTISSTGLAGAPISGAAVIDARGFDGWWFRSWLVRSQRDQIEADFDGIEERMSSALTLPLRGGPNLHVPGRSRIVHPGYSSLMALGDMADAILRPYVEPYLNSHAPLSNDPRELS